MANMAMRLEMILRATFFRSPRIIIPNKTINGVVAEVIGITLLASPIDRAFSNNPYPARLNEPKMNICHHGVRLSSFLIALRVIVGKTLLKILGARKDRKLKVATPQAFTLIASKSQPRARNRVTNKE